MTDNQADEAAIRNLVEEWNRATLAGDIDSILPLMAEDVAFIGAGRPPMRGRQEFADAFRSVSGRIRVEPRTEIIEVAVSGDMAYSWVNINLTMSGDAGTEERRLAGSAISILRKQADGRWVIFRDANMVTPVQPP